MTAREHKLKLIGTRVAKDGDRLVVTKTARVICHLLINACMPIRLDDALENVPNDCPLFGGIKIAFDFRSRDIPVVGNKRSQQPSLGILVIPVETNILFLFRRQGIEKSSDSRFRVGLYDFPIFCPEGGRQRCCCQCRAGSGLEKSASGKPAVVKETGHDSSLKVGKSAGDTLSLKRNLPIGANTACTLEFTAVDIVGNRMLPADSERSA